jgi:hypothetical protein
MPPIPSNIRPDYRPIGADGTILKADSTQAEGTVWSDICYGDIHNLQIVAGTASPAPVLVGAGFYHPNFAFSFSEIVGSSYLQSSTYGTEQTLTSANHTWIGTGIFYNNTPGAFETFTLIAASKHGCGLTTSGILIYWYQPVLWGASPTGVTLDNTFLNALTGYQLLPTKAITFTYTANSGQFLWYAYRSAGGTPTFTVNDLVGGFQLASSGITFLNTSGFVDQYQLWRSDYHSLGAVTVVVT